MDGSQLESVKKNLGQGFEDAGELELVSIVGGIGVGYDILYMGVVTSHLLPMPPMHPAWN